MNNYVEKLSKMIAVKTVSSGNNKDTFIKFWDLIKSLFPNVFKSFNFEIFTNAVLLSYEIKSDKLPILLMSHSDVVSENGKWGTPAFEPTVIGEKMYGRGTLDTKGNLFAILQSLEELIVEGYKFNRSIYVESSFNEETIQTGAKEVAEVLNSRGIKFDFVLDEGGMIVDNPFGKSDKKCAMIALGEKACVELKVISKGNGGHASTPDNVNDPIIRLNKFINGVNKEIKFKKCFPKSTLFTIRSVGKEIKGIKGFLFKNVFLFKHLLINVFNSISPTTKAMVKSTICFTQVHGGDSNNVIPSEVFAIINMRVSHDEGLKNAKQKIEKLAHKYGLEIEYIDSGIETPICDYNSKVFRKYCELIESSFNNVVALPYIANGASDAKFMNLVSENVFRFAPFVISNEQLESVHGINENVDTKSLEPAVNFFKTVIKEM